MKPEQIAQELAHLGASDARLISRMEARLDRLRDDLGALKVNAAHRCEVNTIVARLACEAGHIDESTAAAIIAPKPDPEP